MSYAEKLKTLRKRNNVTQAQLASALGVSLSPIALIESGVRSPSKELSVRLAKYFNVPTDVFLQEDAPIPETTTPRMQIDPDLMTDIIDAITEFLAEKNLEMSAEQRKDLIKHFCNSGLTDQQIIKNTLSAMLALNSELFTKRNTK